MNFDKLKELGIEVSLIPRDLPRTSADEYGALSMEELHQHCICGHCGSEHWSGAPRGWQSCQIWDCDCKQFQLPENEKL